MSSSSSSWSSAIKSTNIAPIPSSFLNTQFVSLINDAIDHKLDENTTNKFILIWYYHMIITYQDGHDQRESQDFQKELDVHVNERDLGIKININHKFLSKHKKMYAEQWKDQEFIDWKDWHQLLSRRHKSLKTNNASKQYDILIELTRWIGHVRNVLTENPATILRHNPKSLHSRIIFQVVFHKLFTFTREATVTEINLVIVKIKQIDFLIQ